MKEQKESSSKEAQKEIEKQKKVVADVQRLHNNAIKQQDELRDEIERERKAKAAAEKLNKDLEKVCSQLRHKALAFLINQVRSARKHEEEQAKLAAEVAAGAASLSELQHQ